MGRCWWAGGGGSFWRRAAGGCVYACSLTSEPQTSVSSFHEQTLSLPGFGVAFDVKRRWNKVERVLNSEVSCAA